MKFKELVKLLKGGKSVLVYDPFLNGNSGGGIKFFMKDGKFYFYSSGENWSDIAPSCLTLEDLKKVWSSISLKFRKDAMIE